MPDPTPQDMLDMPDEEFMNLSAPPAMADGGTDDDDTILPVDTTAITTAVDDASLANTGDDDEDPPEVKHQVDAVEPIPKVDDKSEVSGTLAKDKSGVDGEGDDKDKSTAVASTPNYEEFYKSMMAPFKANGKSIQLQSPEEAIQLMKMGANYTRKMQDIAPHRKVLMMLENNGLLDEGKLSYLIDLDKKNPDAIKKLVKESGIDPLQIDTDDENPTYQLGNHRVSDDEAAFVTALDDLKSTPDGVHTLQAINSEWDQASKEVLWKNPELMSTIHEQRANGIYSQIAAEVERLKVLGTIPSHTPFLNAYKAVGDQLSQAGAFNHLVQKSANAPVTTRVQAPKSAVKNGDKVSAAAPSRSTPKKTEAFVNPLAMDDETFMKQFANRL